MPTKDLFNFSSPDLVNLQKWFRKAPRQFTRAAINTTNTVAFQTRRQQIENIQRGTVTRSKPFVKRSMRIDKARQGTTLDNIIAEAGSIDLSRKGRSDGFKSLEDGLVNKSKRVPTLASRGNNEQKKVAGKVRMNKLSKAFKYKQFRGKGIKSKQQRVIVMLKAVRAGAIGRNAFVIPRGLSGKLGGMQPGIWSMGNSRRLLLGNPFRGKRDRTKRIRWNERAANKVTQTSNLKRIWRKEIDFILRKR